MLLRTFEGKATVDRGMKPMIYGYAAVVTAASVRHGTPRDNRLPKLQICPREERHRSVMHRELSSGRRRLRKPARRIPSLEARGWTRAACQTLNAGNAANTDMSDALSTYVRDRAAGSAW